MSMDKANRRLRRSSAILGFGARLWLIGFWAAVIVGGGLVALACGGVLSTF